MIASAAAALQKDVRELAAAAGLAVDNSQLLPPRELEALIFLCSLVAHR